MKSHKAIGQARIEPNYNALSDLMPKIVNTQWLTSGEWGCPVDIGPNDE